METMSCPHNDIEEKVLFHIKPRKEDYEEAERIASIAIDLVEKCLARNNIEAEEVRIEGSYAKDTWLRGSLDIDVFIIFPREKCRKEYLHTSTHVLYKCLEENGLQPSLDYAEHPYVAFNVEGTRVEAVPACRTRPGEEPLTATDRTPLHTSYVKNRLSAEQRDEVRLLKQFFKTIGVYGAEIRVQGFSGYLTELLIVKYKCFEYTVRAIAAEWKPPVLLTLDNSLGGRTSSLRKVDWKHTPIIVPDPVDPDRNAAKAVSLKSFSKTVLASKIYVKRPSIVFFTKPMPPSLEELVSKAGDRLDRIVIVVLLFGRKRSEDVLYGIGYRVASNIATLLSHTGFTVVDYSVYVHGSDTVLVAVETLEQKLPRIRLRRGPYPWMGDYALDFISKHIQTPVGPWIGRDGRLYALQLSREYNPVDVVVEMKHQWMTKPASEARLYIALLRQLKDTVFFRELGRSDGFREWFSELIEKKPHWLREQY